MSKRLILDAGPGEFSSMGDHDERSYNPEPEASNSCFLHVSWALRLRMIPRTFPSSETAGIAHKRWCLRRGLDERTVFALAKAEH